MDSIHDVTLQAGNRTFAAHKYILSMRSEFFRKLFATDHCGIGEELCGEARKSEDAVGCDLIILENIPADMLEYALDFIYTDSCELLVHKAKLRVPVAQTGQTKVGKSKQFICSRCAKYWRVVFISSRLRSQSVLTRTRTKKDLSAVCRTWMWEVDQPWRCTVPFPLQLKKTSKPRARMLNLARRQKEERVTRLRPMRVGQTQSKPSRLLQKSWAWGACLHGESV